MFREVLLDDKRGNVIHTYANTQGLRTDNDDAYVALSMAVRLTTLVEDHVLGRNISKSVDLVLYS